MPHKEADIGSETFFRFSAQISNQPLRIEGILWRHSIPHDGIEERFSLPGIESKDFDVATNTGQERRQGPIFLFGIATSSASAGRVALQPEAWSLHPPSTLESREHSIIRQVDETYLTENTVLVMRLKKDIDELKNKKIVEMEELLELKSKKEEARAELEAIKTDIAKHQTFLSSLKQFNDQTAAEIL